MSGTQERGAEHGEANESTAKRTRSSAASAETEAHVDIGELSVNQEEEGDVDEWAMDDVVGEELDAGMVAAARKEEVEFMNALGVFEASSWEECMPTTGKAPITTRWIDTGKGTDGDILVRSRLVARDFKKRGRQVRALCSNSSPGGKEDAVQDGDPEGAGPPGYEVQAHVR